MRSCLAAIVGGIVLAGSASQATAKDCKGNPSALGVSRTVEIDATNAPKFGAVQYKGNEFLREKEVVLTFDDGPLRRYTRTVLDALDAHCTKATFFMVGRMAVADPAMVREVAKRGHTIAAHTWSHRNMRSLSAAKATKEFELGLSAIRKALGAAPAPFFRFPYLADSKFMLAHLEKRKFATFSIDADSVDFRTRNGNVMANRIMRQLTARKGGIALFHDIQKSTARGIESVLDRLQKDGFKIVHIRSKQGATTAADADAEAETLFARKHGDAGASKLADRSVVWPVTDGKPQGSALGAAPPAATARPTASEPSSNPSASTAATTAPPSATPAPTQGPDWVSNVFSN